MNTLARLLFEVLVSVVAPPRCTACDAAVAMRTVFCAPCAATLESRDVTSRHVAPFVYGGAIAQAITRFKYEKRPDLARPLADLLRLGIPRGVDSPYDLVCPVPLHPARLAARGFNQAALLSRPIARALDVRFAPLALQRTRDTPKQAMLDREARASNVAGAFRVRRDVRGARVLLVDDVRTTGATLAACEAALVEAGAREVTHAVIAAAALS